MIMIILIIVMTMIMIGDILRGGIKEDKTAVQLKPTIVSCTVDKNDEFCV